MEGRKDLPKPALFIRTADHIIESNAAMVKG
jgi:hypothetical protein